MIRLPSPRLLVAGSLLFSLPALGQGAAGSRPVSLPQVSVRPTARILSPVDNAVLTSLPGTHPVRADRAIAGSRLDSATPLAHLRLVLTPTDEQRVALNTLMAQQQDATSTNFHKWLTPDSFGQSFGAAPADIARVSAWLADNGLKVESTSKSNRVITFAGSAGQVEAAFHTELRHVTVDGEAHITNTTDLQVPAAFAGVVRGVASLNDFLPKSQVFHPHTTELTTQIPPGNQVAVAGHPLFTNASSGTHSVAPGDVATIFNSNPLLSAGIDGTGQTVVVLGRSNIQLSDIQQFRSMFGLKKNDPTITVLGNDPGLNGDDIEAFLDVEWAGGVAPGANVNFIVGGPDYYFSSGIDAAGLYAVDNNIGDIISLSYGGCETSFGASGTAFWNTLWEQAAAQGQTVFVSTGDSSATGCQSSSATYGTAYGVNAIGSSAYNVAVGGSMFVDYGPSQYWNAGVSAPAPAGYTFATATSYIPEAPWNEGLLTTTLLNGASTAAVQGYGIVGGGGGISIYTGRPSWQTGSGISPTADPTATSGTGIAAGSPISGPHRLVPDLSLIAASGHDPTLFCGEGNCYNTSTGYSVGAVGGTSVATPVMASVQALINQKNGGRQGNANFHYYPLANVDYAAGNCKSINGTAASPTVTLPAATCNFNDLVTGGNNVPQSASDTVGLGFLAQTGFDAASGLGTINITNLANNWASVNLRSTATTFTITPAAGIQHGVAQLISVTVSPGSGTGTPTGDFALIAETTTPSATLRYTLAAGTYSGSINGLPGGSYNVHVHYEGDGNFGPSDSPSLPVVISKENSATTSTSHYILGTSILTNPASVPFGSVFLLNTGVAATSSSTTVPTGTITYSVTRNGSALAPLVETVDGAGHTSLQAGANSSPLYLKATYPLLTPGAYVITASYSGDASYAGSSSTTSFTLAAGVPVTVLTQSATNINAGQSVNFNYKVTRPAATTYVTPVVAQPTGTVTFTNTTTGLTLGSANLDANGNASLASNSFNAGANTVRATYNGDANYATATSTVTVTQGTLNSTTTILSIAGGSYSVGSAVPLTATVSPASTGTVTFFDGSVTLGSATLNGSSIATLNYAGLTAGSHNLSASYRGNTTNATSTGTLTYNINQATTSITLDAPTTSIYGQAIAFSGRILRSPSSTTVPLVPLTGTISFLDGTTTVATAVPVILTPPSGGTVYYSGTAIVTTLAAGSHSFTASYSGDANYAGSTSGKVNTTIASYAAPLTLAASSVVVSSNGGNLTFTATQPVASNLAAPSGTVSFYSGGTLLGTVSGTYSAAAGGYVYTLTVAASSLPAGTQTISAVFNGDANYSSTTATLIITVTVNHVWVANRNTGVSGLTQAGSAVSGGGSSGGGTGVAIDHSGNIWSLDPASSSVGEFSKTGVAINPAITAGGINAPTALAIDGTGYIWIANGNGTLSVLSASGTPVSNTALTAPTSAPSSLTIDSSGNLWITNTGDDSVTQVIGAAAPVITPITNAVKANALAVKP